jgi:ATP-dependent Lon protease
MMNKNDSDDNNIFPVSHIEIDPSKFNGEPHLDDLPLIATRNLVLFPGVTFPVSLVRQSSLATAEAAHRRNEPVGMVCQIAPETDEPTFADLYKYGVIVDVLKVLHLPDDTHTAVVRARQKIKLLKKGDGAHMPEASLSAVVRIVKETNPRKDDQEFVAMSAAIKDATVSILKKLGDNLSEMSLNVSNYPEPVGLINMVATHAPIEVRAKQELLSIPRLKARAFALLAELMRSEQMVDITREMQERARRSLDSQQRSHFLHQQMEEIRQELYGDQGEVAQLEKRAAETKFPKDVEAVFNKELDKLRRTNQQSPDWGVQISYLETLLDLPWGKYSQQTTDFAVAEETLNAEHYGLDKVKDRILEQLAIMLNTPDGNSPILCLVGPPGVGKTSLGQSIARALGRKYQRVSLGGLHDESEIRGHRRTYIGAMPGRIMDAIRRSGTANPVLLLDEVDKVGSDFKGDPSAALLEVLDPEQNSRFHDNYIDVDFDLSKVLFIATANTLSTLSQPLIDRMEVIDISGYLLEEKVEIAIRHLLPRLQKKHAFADGELTFSRDAIVKIIEGYTSESGVRQLEKQLAQIARKVVRAKVSGKEWPHEIKVENLKDFLGVERYTRDRYEGNDFPGVVTGLAWTAVGGEILFIESSLSQGKGEKLTLTGNLGDVMKESAVIALQYVKAHAAELNIPMAKFDTQNLHIHVPEGAIPKDGPSAGITMATSIVSAYTGRLVRERLAMTGEITLRGKVLPVGGIKEKILAAKRAGITDIILSEANRKDVEAINSIYVSGLTFHYVSTVSDVISQALV